MHNPLYCFRKGRYSIRLLLDCSMMLTETPVWLRFAPMSDALAGNAL